MDPMTHRLKSIMVCNVTNGHLVAGTTGALFFLGVGGRLFKCSNTRLFVSGLSPHLKIFHSYGDVTIDSEGLQILPMLGSHGH